MTEPAQPPTATADPLTVINERIGKGMEWLTTHDPHGAFHFWYKAGLTARSPMPSHDEVTVADWKRYYANRVTFEDLMKRADRLEREKGTP